MKGYTRDMKTTTENTQTRQPKTVADYRLIADRNDSPFFSKASSKYDRKLRTWRGALIVEKFTPVTNAIYFAVHYCHTMKDTSIHYVGSADSLQDARALVDNKLYNRSIDLPTT